MRNKKMTILAVLLIAVAVTAYSVSGTYAKYTTTKESTDSARVAKWGIGVENEIDLFAASYTGVQSADGANVVAPGTKGEYTFALTGAPETNYTLVVEATGTESAPIGRIVYKLDEDATEYTTIKDLSDAIEALYDNTKVYAANTSSASPHKISWAWAFDEGQDVADTTLGDAETLADVKLTVKITATQTQADAN